MSQAFVKRLQIAKQNIGFWERNLQSSSRVEESLDKRGSWPWIFGFCFFVNSTSGWFITKSFCSLVFLLIWLPCPQPGTADGGASGSGGAIQGHPTTHGQGTRLHCYNTQCWLPLQSLDVSRQKVKSHPGMESRVVDTDGKWKKSLIRKILIILSGHLWIVELPYI